jgi:hypothetical protein
VTLFVHEVHRVRGAHEDEFEAAFRDADGWMDRLGRGSDARLLWYLDLAHGSGPSYQVVTITAVEDGAAWERLARSMLAGDLAGWARRVDTLRHDVVAKILVPVAWSPLAAVDLASIPTTPAEHGATLFMEDTMWPTRGLLAEYLRAAEGHYVPLLGRPESLLRLDLALVSAAGGQPGPEVVLVQAVKDPRRIVTLLASEIGPDLRPPGSWMHDALRFRDQWRSRLLRAASWSPWS